MTISTTCLLNLQNYNIANYSIFFLYNSNNITPKKGQDMDDKVKEALTLFKNEKYEDALKIFFEMQEEDKLNPHIYSNIGLCYAKLGQDELAEENYLKALSIDAGLAQTYINLADLYYKEKRIADALELLQQGAYELPENVGVLHYLARFFIEDKRYQDAIDVLDKILDLSPENPDAHWDLGMVYFELGDWNSAIANFEEVLEKLDNNELAYFQTALAYEANDEIDKAISNYLKAIAVNDKFIPAYKKAATLFMARGDIEDATEYFEDFLKFDLPEEEKTSVEKVLASLKKKKQN